MGKIKISANIEAAFDDIKKEVIKSSQVALYKVSDSQLTATKTSEYMPRNDGTMQEDDTYLDPNNYTPNNDEYSIVTDSVYARRLYYHPEYNFQKGNNSKAGGRWHDRRIKAEGGIDKIQKDFAEFLDKELNK